MEGENFEESSPTHSSSLPSYDSYQPPNTQNLKALIKPTQSQLGYAWVQYKYEIFFQTKDDAQDQMDNGLVPVVIGPDNFFYIVDDHHSLSALDFSGELDVSVTLDVICDKRAVRSMSAFWTEMKNEHLVYLGSKPVSQPNSLPEQIEPSDLPSYFSFTQTDKSLSNDPWRAMVSFSRKVEKVPDAPACPSSSDTCMRCMYRGCVDGTQSSGAGVPYFEFQWSYMMVDSTFYNISLWPSEDSRNSFYQAYSALSSQIPYIDTNSWLDAASLIITLCRSSKISEYTVPTDIYSNQFSGMLPGFVLGYEQLEDDPDCDSPVCHS